MEGYPCDSGQSNRPSSRSLPKRSAEHRLGKFELNVTFEPRRCSAFQITGKGLDFRRLQTGAGRVSISRYGE